LQKAPPPKGGFGAGRLRRFPGTGRQSHSSPASPGFVFLTVQNITAENPLFSQKNDVLAGPGFMVMVRGLVRVGNDGLMLKL